MTDHAKDEDRKESVEEALEETQELNLNEEELEALCKEHVCPGCTVMAEAEDKFLRGLAETENVKRRLCREADDLRKYAGETVLADMLPVLDNLDLALAHAGNLEGCKDFVVGVDMTRKAFLDVLEKHGLSAISGKGKEFDPQLQEAVGMAQDQELPDNYVVQVVQSGYTLKGRLLRPAKVMVNKIENQED